MPGWTLLTFGGGLPNWRAAAHRLSFQSNSSNWFEQVVCLTDGDLRRQYSDFFSSNREFLSARVRGYGYWIWKPFLISRVLESLRPDAPGLVYLDAGCELNVNERSAARMRQYQSLALDASSGLFLQHIPDNSDLMWTKADTRRQLGLPYQLAAQPQVMATAVVAANKTSTRDFINEWLRVAAMDRYHFLDDSPSLLNEDPAFVEHRHDQSILSCLAKVAGVQTIADETFWAPDWEARGSQYPIWALRNRSRASARSRRATSDAVRFVEKSYSRIFRAVLGRK